MKNLRAKKVLYDERDIIDRIRKGEVFIYPTDTAYGIGAGIDHTDAIERIYNIKNRPASKPVPVLIHRQEVQDLAEFTEVEEEAMNRHWPGALTLVLTVKERKTNHWITEDGTIALRDPGFDFLRRIIKESGPIVGTSANVSGRDTPYRLEEVEEKLLKQVDFVAGDDEAGTKSSTVAQWDDQDRKWIVHREGPIGRTDLQSITNPS